MLKRSKQFVQVAWFLAAYGERNLRGTSDPPSELGADTWLEAYEMFYPALGDGRTLQAFSNSLKNSRDSFDSWLRKSGRVGWRNEEVHSEPAPLSTINREVDAEFSRLSRNAAWKRIEHFAFPAKSDTATPVSAVIEAPMVRRWDHDIVDDIQEIVERKALEPTTRKSLIDARIGQGGFRSQVLGIWRNRCAVTGCTIMDVIRASHIIPWRDSSDHDRLNPYNGLPLVANLDALFDSGLIAFDDYGEMLISSELPESALKSLSVDACGLRTPPPSDMIPFLRSHRAMYFRK